MDREIVRRRHLPHWDLPGATYFVTTCLKGSIPAQGLLELAAARRDWRRRPKPQGMSVEDWRAYCWKRDFVRVENWLDTQPAITYSVNRFTGTACNRLLNVKGAFWQTESYDHWVRDVDELERIIRYIEENPAKAGLVQPPEQWLFSSAFARAQSGAKWGTPLYKGMSGLES
jgi:hypothetical protein